MKLTGIVAAKVVAIVLLGTAATGGHTYGFYTLLRWVVCPVCAYAALDALGKEKAGWVWILSVLAMLFNPVLPVHLGREIWQPVDLVAAGLVTFSIFTVDMQRKAE